MKKYTLIVGLLLALSLGFTSCGGGDNDDDKKKEGKTVIWKLTDVLAKIGVKSSVVAADLTDTGVALVGSPTLEIKKVGDAFVLEITTAANWGQGIDLQDSKFKFVEGDTVTLTGTYTGSPSEIYLTTKAGNGETHTLKPPTASPFKIEATLTAEDITNIAATGQDLQQAIRIAAKPDNITFVITEITIER